MDFPIKAILKNITRWWFQIFVMFNPENWGMISNLTNIFSDGLVQPPTSFDGFSGFCVCGVC